MPHHALEVTLRISVNGLYIAMNAVLLILSVVTVLWARKASKDSVHKFIVILLFVNFACTF